MPCPCHTHAIALDLLHHFGAPSPGAPTISRVLLTTEKDQTGKVPSTRPVMDADIESGCGSVDTCCCNCIDRTEGPAVRNCSVRGHRLPIFRVRYRDCRDLLPMAWRGFPYGWLMGVAAFWTTCSRRTGYVRGLLKNRPVSAAFFFPVTRGLAEDGTLRELFLAGSGGDALLPDQWGGRLRRASDDAGVVAVAPLAVFGGVRHAVHWPWVGCSGHTARQTLLPSH